MGYQVHFSYFYGKPLNYDYRDHTRNSNSYSRSQHLAPLFERAVSPLWFFFHSNSLSYIILLIIHVFKIITLVKCTLFLG